MDEYRWEAHLQDLLRVASGDDQAVLQIDDLPGGQDGFTVLTAEFSNPSHPFVTIRRSLEGAAHDGEVLLWGEWEPPLDAEMLGQFGSERFGQLRFEILSDVMLRRRTGDGGDKTNPVALHELEEATVGSDALMLSAKPPTGLAPLDLYFANESYQKVLGQLVPANYERRLILGRIRQRVHRFLSETEAALEFSVAASGAFERAGSFQAPAPPPGSTLATGSSRSRRRAGRWWRPRRSPRR